jgi:hypothetical protein
MRLNLMGTTERIMIGGSRSAGFRLPHGASFLLPPLRCLLIGFTDMSGMLNGVL